MEIADQIKALYPQVTDADFVSNIIIVDFSDGKGPIIKDWKLDVPLPTQDELAATTPPLTVLEAVVVETVQNMLDTFAQTRRYINIISACTYVNSTNLKFQKEGQYCVNMRDTYWAICYQILNDVLSGLRPVPTLDEVLEELPPLVWPT